MLCENLLLELNTISPLIDVNVDLTDLSFITEMKSIEIEEIGSKAAHAKEGYVELGVRLN